MKMKCIYFDEVLSFNNECFYTIVLEDKKAIIEFLTYLNNDFCDNRQYLYLIDDKGKELKLEDNIFFISNIFQLELNTKKNINALYKKLTSLYKYKINDDLLEIKNKCESIVEEISVDFDIRLNIGTSIDITDLFKIMNISFLEDYNDIKEKLIKYMLILNEINGYKIYILYGLHQYFTDSEINDIFTELKYHDISLINLEIYNNFNKGISESIKILDVDYCSIE